MYTCVCVFYDVNARQENHAMCTHDYRIHITNILCTVNKNCRRGPDM